MQSDKKKHPDHRNRGKIRIKHPENTKSLTAQTTVKAFSIIPQIHKTSSSKITQTQTTKDEKLTRKKQQA